MIPGVVSFFEGPRGRGALRASARTALLAGAWLLTGIAFTPAEPDSTEPPRPRGAEDVLRTLDADGRVELSASGVTLTRVDFMVGADTVEAIAFAPPGEGQHPAVLLIPGYSRSARDYVPFGVRLASAGFAGLAVSMPGFGRSGGTADFCGPATMTVLHAALDRLRHTAGVDSTRIAVYGYSRGALAAAILAVREVGLRGAILAAGVYDLRRAYDTIEVPGIQENIRAETGLSEAALRVRSPLFDMESLSCPVLILHGERDANAPVSQAHLLRDRLTELRKPFDIVLYPDRDHDLGMTTVLEATLAFLGDTLE